MVSDVRRFDICLVSLDPTRATEIRKTRPCVVVSPDEMNRYLRTVIVAPMTTASKPYPTRVGLRFQGKSGQIAADQIRTIDGNRIVRRLGRVSETTARKLCAVLTETFAY
ncbi:MAG: type II toxin-antitoxin system PemK/MazF family toxin [Alphaproteobacteria bacterium]|nr:type II toxin-antitoxin system PemK/MazF family toxin [Alphaproteobacteria bacterium]